MVSTKLRRLSSLPVDAFHPVLLGPCSCFGVTCVSDVSRLDDDERDSTLGLDENQEIQVIS